MHIDKSDIEGFKKIYRLNLINSISGIKPANLIGTRSLKQIDNVAIFSSVVHLGSNPAQLGFIMRPQSNKFSDTFKNIKDTGCYTINHIHADLIKRAHYTSAKLRSEESEFETMNIEKEFIKDFYAPFVKESFVKIGMELLKCIHLPNECYLVIGSVKMIELPDDIINDQGQINLESSGAIGISGLNSYFNLNKIESHPYVGNNQIPNF